MPAFFAIGAVGAGDAVAVHVACSAVIPYFCLPLALLLESTAACSTHRLWITTCFSFGSSPSPLFH